MGTIGHPGEDWGCVPQRLVYYRGAHSYTLHHLWLIRLAPLNQPLQSPVFPQKMYAGLVQDDDCAK